MVNKDNKQAGVTLIEILVWITITAILGAALSGLFSSLIKNYMYGQRRYDIQQTADLVLLNIANELRYGENYNIVDYNQALDNNALYYESIRPDEPGTFLYYIDKDNFHFYRVPFTGGTPALVPGHTFVEPGDIQIGKIDDPDTDIFAGDNTHMNISIRVTDTVYQQHIDQRTMVIPINQFVK
ncbi:PulJ/GspJ family protein [Sporomusa termitida]|uniref:Prepilin-type N-terminal cleavage/methylation domain-containing protein n=1 Tax=Sporomusa termitida TaxID=2377 RepID=A0A517DSP5_9FIRM|nr:prepilin-type N-terminal cleavage/methylation domain-containing protein [Sporomusa termitida]QDR80338.1 hypothetical protein SPTER_16610 [Sporomusa termitida]